MNTTKDKLSAYITISVMVSLILVMLSFVHIIFLFSLLLSSLVMFHFQDKYDEWKLSHSDINDIKMWADMDRPE